MRHLMPLRYIDRIVRTGSIRSAAEYLAISPSALNRRILSLEGELGTQIFERLATGVRLSTAGEIYYRHIQTQLADFDEVRSRIADLSGLRAGQVTLGVSPELVGPFLYNNIDSYQNAFPGVHFAEQICNAEDFEPLLSDFSIDLAVAFQPQLNEGYRTLAAKQLPVHCCVPVTSDLSGLSTLRLYQLIDRELVMPAQGTGLYRLLNASAGRKSIELTARAVTVGNPQSLGAAFPRAIRFSVVISDDSTVAPAGFKFIPLDTRDVPLGTLSVGQLRQRTLPVAPAKFAEQLIRSLAV